MDRLYTVDNKAVYQPRLSMTLLPQIHPISLREQVVQQIRTAIIEGRLKPNDHITETTLTSQLGVSRTPVREALILLEREGLVVASPNRGCFVRAFTERDVIEIFTLRTALENFAGELIIQKLTQPDFEYLYNSVQQQSDAIANRDIKRVHSVDMDFHRYLVEKSGHDLLIRDWTEIVAQIAAVLYIRAEVIPDYDQSQSIHDHRAIVDAYKRRDLHQLQDLNRQINGRVAAECQRAIAQQTG
jgi:DNA-binding GntR family transcriptional regulator